MNSVKDNYSEFVEVDPSGRYGRYNEVLGKGASKTVYRAFDLYEGIEVAWNQVKLSNFLQNSDYLERLYSEIHLLKRLKHPNIMKLYASWADVSEMNVNFITEMFTSGTLRQYRHKHKTVNIRAVKDWCRQILRGLQYLHSQKPPVIHRDLKCDNIFVNGNHGEVKIGDLGLAAVLQNVSESHCVGTPEFMAPEVYNEKYNELVDIYSFGMCILEMVTFEYPYSECATPAQIYMKVTSGKKPDALYQVQDPEVFQFIEKCLADVSERLSARELLNDPFLQIQDFESNLTHSQRELDYIDDVWRHLILGLTHKTNSFGNNSFNENSDTSHVESEWSWHDNEPEDDFPNLDITIKGKKQEDGNLFFGLRISSEVQPRNIHFPFDLENDTALSVATEMVQQLDITDHNVTKIAEMIDWEIAVLVPNWRNGLEMEETPCLEMEETPPFADGSFRQNCASNHNSGGSFTNRCENECRVNSRFEEYSDSTQNPELPIKSNNFQQEEYWNQHESFECSEIGSGDSHSSEEHGNIGDKQTRSEDKDLPREKSFTKSLSTSNSIALSSRELSVDYEHEINEEFRWLQAKYEEMEEIIKQHMKVHVEFSGLI